MKKVLGILAFVLFLAAAEICNGQAKIYTKKAKLEDFSTKITKVVSPGNSLFGITFLDEIKKRWRISPFEFCTKEEYESLKNNNDYYFLRTVKDRGFVFIILSKGGIEENPDRLKRPFEVVKVPLGDESGEIGRGFALMGAITDIIQNFVEDAMVSDEKGYFGLLSYNKIDLKGKKICLNPEEGDRLMSEGTSDTLIGVTVSSSNPDSNFTYYNMLISADTHELFLYQRKHAKDANGYGFSEFEIEGFKKRGGEIIR